MSKIVTIPYACLKKEIKIGTSFIVLGKMTHVISQWCENWIYTSSTIQYIWWWMRDILYVKIMFLVEKVFLYLIVAPNLPLVSNILIIQLTIISFELNFDYQFYQYLSIVWNAYLVVLIIRYRIFSPWADNCRARN